MHYLRVVTISFFTCVGLLMTSQVQAEVVIIESRPKVIVVEQQPEIEEDLSLGEALVVGAIIGAAIADDESERRREVIYVDDGYRETRIIEDDYAETVIIENEYGDTMIIEDDGYRETRIIEGDYGETVIIDNGDDVIIIED